MPAEGWDLGKVNDMDWMPTVEGKTGFTQVEKGHGTRKILSSLSAYQILLQLKASVMFCFLSAKSQGEFHLSEEGKVRSRNCLGMRHHRIHSVHIRTAQMVG